MQHLQGTEFMPIWPEFKRQAEAAELNSPRSCNLTGLFMGLVNQVEDFHL